MKRTLKGCAGRRPDNSLFCINSIQGRKFHSFYLSSLFQSLKFFTHKSSLPPSKREKLAVGKELKRRVKVRRAKSMSVMKREVQVAVVFNISCRTSPHSLKFRLNPTDLELSLNLATYNTLCLCFLIKKGNNNIYHSQN